LIERSFAGGDRFSIVAISDMAMLANDRELAVRAFEALQKHEHECATLGLMGTNWCGPVAYSLGKIARWLGRDDADAWFKISLDLATRMHAQPFVARTLLAQGGRDNEAQQMMSDLSLRPTRVAPTEAPVPTSATTDVEQTLKITPQGDIWQISYGGERVMIKSSKGLAMLEQLVRQPGKEFHVLDLSGASGAPDTGDAGPILDEHARSEYKTRVAELQEELDEAEILADTGRADSIREELDFITRELSQAFGLGGQQRRSGSAAERARVNVRRRIKDAIKRIGEQLPEAGRYLDNTIKTGTYCRYSPM